MECLEPVWVLDRTRARAKEGIPEGTPVLKIIGPAVKAPGQDTIQVDERFHISAAGSPWRSIRHSCDPNCAVNFNTWTFYATRPIEAGTDLTYNFLTTEWELTAPFRCACGARCCQGDIAGFKHLPLSRQEELAPTVSPYLLRRLFELGPIAPRRTPGGNHAGSAGAVYVFIPYTVQDGHIQSFDYDIPSFRAEVKSWFDALGLAWRWVPITLENLERTLAKIQSYRAAGNCTVLNLCDGSDIDASPGVSVVRALEKAGFAFTGGSSHFYWVTTPKVLMKQQLAEKNIPIPPFVPLRNLPQDLELLDRAVGYPAIVKPEVSAGSNGISLRSLVYDAASAADHIARLFQGKDGEFYQSSGIFAERFVEGPEFTVLVVGNHEQPGEICVYSPVERVFHSALPPNERFLSFDRYWSEYKEEPRLPEGEPFYRYALAPPLFKERLADLALRAFLALDGTGYARVDIRLETRTGELFVLEVNSNCGLSGDRETSVGEILHLTGTSIHTLIKSILRAARARWQQGP